MALLQNNRSKAFKIKRMKSILSSLFFAAILFGLSGCDFLKKEDKCERDYSFSIPVSLTPALDTFNVGDTIHISIEFSPEMEDQNSGEFFDLIDYPFNTDIGLAKVDENPAACGNTLVSYVEGRGDLKLVPLSGGCISPQAYYETFENSLVFSCQIILNTSPTLLLYKL